MHARTRSARSVQAAWGPASSFHPQAVLAGIVTAFAASLALSAVLAAVIYFTDVTETSIGGVLYYLGIVTVLLGGAVAGRAAPGRGWLHGGLAGLGYVVISLTLGSVLFPGSALLAGIATKLVLAFVAGAVGGIVGVNL